MTINVPGIQTRPPGEAVRNPALGFARSRTTLGIARPNIQTQSASMTLSGNIFGSVASNFAGFDTRYRMRERSDVNAGTTTRATPSGELPLLSIAGASR